MENNLSDTREELGEGQRAPVAGSAFSSSFAVFCCLPGSGGWGGISVFAGTALASPWRTQTEAGSTRQKTVGGKMEKMGEKQSSNTWLVHPEK